MNPAFIGFAPADIDTIVLRAYTRGDNFQHLVDTVVIVNQNAIIYTTSHDTTIVDANSSNPNHFVNPNFDWKIYIPAKNKTISISNIMSDATKGPGRTCLNPILSFVQDGETVVPHLVETGKFYTSGYMVYIHN
ncbi:MAG: hypothetical protein ACXVIY_06975 [Mucilaginibacter sp.]